MNDDKVKLSFRDTLGLMRYGLSLVRRMTPKYLSRMTAQALLGALQPLIVLFFSARILNELAGGRDVGTIVLFSALTVGLTFALSTARTFLNREIELVTGWERVLHRMHMMQARRFTEMDFTHTEDGNVSEVLARMDMMAMGNGLGLINMYVYPSAILGQLFSLLFSALLLTGWLTAGVAGATGAVAPGASPFALGLYGLFVVGMLVTLWFTMKEKKILDEIYEDNARANTIASFLHEYVRIDQAAKDVRLYDQGPALGGIVQQSFSLKEWWRYFTMGGRNNGFNAALLAAIAGGFYLLAGLDALGGAGTVGNIVQSVGAVKALATAVGSLVSLLGQAYNNATYLKPMREYLTLPDLLVKGKRPVPMEKGHVYHFEFKDVSFRYPGSEEYALKNLNMKLDAGKRLAVVGVNGSGKTTMIKLLCRFYDPTEGEILLDGVNIKEYDYDQYIALFSVVFQDYILFPLWIGQNVATAEEYDAEKVAECLAGAGFHDRLQSMPEGLDTILYKNFDEDGTTVSGGEAQKIALARALYKDAPMVVLDEPTAALDPIAEHEVYTTFDKTIGDKTAVFISHRLSSCRFCDDIVVFEGGKLIQRGDHETLLADAEGRYRELWNAQAQHYNENVG